MSGYLGWANVPPGQVGWDGHSGSVDIQGPAPKPAGWFETPDPSMVVAAMTVTEWTCHACGEDNDVWGEGAIENWMDCGHCSASSYLSMDKFFEQMNRYAGATP